MQNRRDQYVPQLTTHGSTNRLATLVLEVDERQTQNGHLRRVRGHDFRDLASVDQNGLAIRRYLVVRAVGLSARALTQISDVHRAELLLFSSAPIATYGTPG